MQEGKNSKEHLSGFDYAPCLFGNLKYCPIFHPLTFRHKMDINMNKLYVYVCACMYVCI